MKEKLLLFVAALLATAGAYAQAVLPEFSTEETPVWYYVQFHTGGHTMADKGTGQKIRTADRADADAQKWQLIGTREGFVMKSKSGNYVNFSGGRFTTSATAKAELKLVESGAAGADGCWEIQRKNSNQSMNQFGGTSLGVELGEWTANDANNPLNFVAADAALPEFSVDGGKETWYFLVFCRTGNTLFDGGAGKTLVTALADPIDGQLWKLVGTPDNFQLVSKSGHYAVVKGTGDAARVQASDKPSASGYRLSATTTTYAPAWEIHVNGASGRVAFNQWSTVKVGQEIGIWTANDANNPLEFVKPEKMTYADYKVVGTASWSPANLQTLWYTQPATLADAADKWMEYSLPIGNGQFGASIFGGVYREEVQFNEKTLWSGRSTDNGVEYGDYENFGSVFIENLTEGEFSFGTSAPVQDYYRYLDLTTATAGVSFANADKSVTYKREYVASNPDKVVAMHLTASEKGKINLRFTLAAGRPGIKAATAYADGQATFGGKLETVSYSAAMRVVPTGGTLETTDAGITVRGADEVLVVLGGATDFDAYAASFVSGTSALPKNVAERVRTAAERGWEAIYADHVADYRRYFDRVAFRLDGAANTLPTDELVKAYAKRTTGMEPAALMLEQLYFHYGRYLEICSSRGVDLPSNLQGIWNNSSEPAWNADIHANINVQMNYWPAEPTNLPEMHLPFLNYIMNMAMNHKQWQGYAHDAGQRRGWTCYTENNIFGGVGSFLHSYVIANAWYCTHLWQHYRYTLDKDFLKKAFPTMLSAAQFWMDRLKLDRDGTYVCPNEYSPEQGPIEDGVAHAQQLVAELFANTLAALDVLGGEAGISDEDLAKLQDRYAKLDRGLATETYTGSWGDTVNGVSKGDVLLREWKTSNYTVGQNGHRHMSHLMCVYPFSQVIPGSKYFEAALNSMKLRGDASTGWSMGWKINLWARVLDGDRAHDILELALRHHSVGGGGVYYNLYDAHTPFQIDGNFGACAGIAEMLMQSHTDTIQILPALPAVWREGSVSGLKAVGDFTVDIAWKGGKPTRVTISNNQGRPCYVKYPGIADVAVYVNDVAQEMESGQANVRLVSGQAGDRIVLDFDGSYQPNGICDVQAVPDAGITVRDRVVTVSAADVERVTVTDLAGRELQQTVRRSFRVDAAAGQVVVVSVKRKSGGFTAYKVVL